MSKTDWLRELRQEIADNPRKSSYQRSREYIKQKKEEEKLEWERKKNLLKPIAREFIEGDLIPLLQEMAKKGCRGCYATFYVFQDNETQSGISFRAQDYLKYHDYLVHLNYTFETMLVAKELAPEYGINVKGTKKTIIFRIKYR